MNYSLAKKYNYNTLYKYRGRENKTILPEFVDICKKTQNELIDWIPEKLLEFGYEDIVITKDYIYAKGSIPVLLTAHMDTVHTEIIKDFYEHEENGKHILSSPQGIGGDDRCGIYIILEVIKTHKCSVLFCSNEEIGCVGSKKFCKTEFIQELEELNYLIGLDRANSDDAVFYDCDNKDFTEFIINNTGFYENYGSFSDISYLAPACKVAAVNLSCGYYKAHTLGEEVIIEEMLNTIEIVKKLLSTESKKFEYVERKSYYDYGYGFNYNRFRNYYDDDDDYDYNYPIYSKKKNNVMLSIQLEDGVNVIMKGADINEAWKNFFINNPDVCYNDVLDFDIYEL